MEFIVNILIGIGSFSLWYLAGTGPALALLPNAYKRYFLFVAPLIGMSLLTLMGFFEISVLLMPLMPHVNFVILSVISLFLIAQYWRKNPIMFSYAWQKPNIWFWLAPLIFLFVFAWLFHVDGYQLLVGSSDQLQYTLDARQILEFINTKSVNDLPITRHDHIVHDVATRLLSYGKHYRRGAEVQLATMKSLTGLSYQEMFPVLVLSAFLSLGLILAFIGRVFLRFSITSCLILQTLFLSSYYLILVHVQGSLALILALSLSLFTLVLFARIAQKPSWHWLLLGAIVTAAYFTIYSEPSLVNVFIPVACLTLWQIRYSRQRFFSAIKYFALLFLLAFIFTPYSLNAIIFRIIDCINPVIAAFLNSSASEHSHGLFANFAPIIPEWNLDSVLLGFSSYYDTSAFNASMATRLASNPWYSPIIFIIFCGLGFWGLIRNKTLLAYVYAVPLIFWILVPFLMANAEILRFSRGLHYSIPFAFIGLVAFINHRKAAISWANTSLVWLGKAVLFSFIVMNICTSARTIHYLTAHNIYTDPLIPRFDQRHEVWANLRKELQFSELQKIPVLVAGFQDTVRPLMIVANIPDQSHVLGEGLSRIWPLYKSRYYQLGYEYYNTHLSKHEFELALQQEDKYWTKDMVSKLIKQSQQAIVPIGNGYPSEWVKTKDIYPAVTKRFTNIGDVIYRNQYSMVLADKMASVLQHDHEGQYRLLAHSGKIIVKSDFESPQQVTMIFDGKPADIQVKQGNQVLPTTAIRHQRQQITFVINPEKKAELAILVKHPVKLREINCQPV